MKERDSQREGFHVPDNYFESLDDKLMSRINQDSKKGFRVPENYFTDFEVKPPKVSEQDGIVRLKRPQVKRLIWIAAAASVLLFFGINYTSNDASKLDWNELDQSEIVSWIESDLSGLDAYDLAEAYPETELSETTISNEELNAYLNEIELDEILYEN